MDRTKRRSRRLAEKRRRTRKSGKRRMSVGDAFGVRACEGVDVTNLAEANAMSSAIAAAANLTEPMQSPARASVSAKAARGRPNENHEASVRGDPVRVATHHERRWYPPVIGLQLQARA